ncbi:MAG: hypothetical protein LBR21_00315 [Propionibacteriaceae bacterium]|jgi:hypothetical protein|nr:hypothetical protein [Propionibacteriaceae bacterium]
MHKAIPAAAAFVLALPISSASTAQAEESGNVTQATPATCDYTPIWTISKKKTNVYIPGSERAYGHPGVQVAIEVGETTTWSGSITGFLTAEAGTIFAKASTSFSTTVSMSGSETLSKTGTWVVPSSAPIGGYLEAGAAGVSFKYEKTWWVSPCKERKASGTGKGVTRTSNVWFRGFTF